MVTSSTLNSRIGIFFLIATIISPGNFHASTAFLPSSFAMYMVMLGAAAFMNWRGGLRTSYGIFWFAAAGILGWPFAAALCAPFILEEAVFALFNDSSALFESFMRALRGATAGLILVVSEAAPTLGSFLSNSARHSMLQSTCSSTRSWRLCHGTLSSTTSFPPLVVLTCTEPSPGHFISRTSR